MVHSVNNEPKQFWKILITFSANIICLFVVGIGGLCRHQHRHHGAVLQLHLHSGVDEWDPVWGVPVPVRSQDKRWVRHLGLTVLVEAIALHWRSAVSVLPQPVHSALTTTSTPGPQSSAAWWWTPGSPSHTSPHIVAAGKWKRAFTGQGSLPKGVTVLNTTTSSCSVGLLCLQDQCRRETADQSLEGDHFISVNQPDQFWSSLTFIWCLLLQALSYYNAKSKRCCCPPEKPRKFGSHLTFVLLE